VGKVRSAIDYNLREGLDLREVTMITKQMIQEKIEGLSEEQLKQVY